MRNGANDISVLANAVLNNIGKAPKVQKVMGKPPTKEELFDFAEETRNGAFALDFWDLNAPRNWRDKYGNTIKNWRGCFLRYCKAIRQKERNQANTKPTTNKRG